MSNWTRHDTTDDSVGCWLVKIIYVTLSRIAPFQASLLAESDPPDDSDGARTVLATDPANISEGEYIGPKNASSADPVCAVNSELTDAMQQTETKQI